ncbi:MAG: hypothetical protein HOP30_02945 [Cyclobacteriaceae bacterium]|nr:hypothetical protein [Cyclobacteriaceae bacterium]
MLLLALLMTSCSWGVNLLIANTTSNDIFVRYTIPSDNENHQFFKAPKTYTYDASLLKLYKLNENKRPQAIPTEIRMIQETDEIEIRLAPGQVVHIGIYYSFQQRQEILSRYKLNVVINKEPTITPTIANSQFRHWKNRRTDIWEVGKSIDRK